MIERGEGSDPGRDAARGTGKRRWRPSAAAVLPGLLLLGLVVASIVLLRLVLAPSGASSEPGASVPAPRARPKCAECGVVGATRPLPPPANPVGGPVAAADMANPSHEVTVRMLDGSQRQITEVRSTVWRPGERVIVIEGRAAAVE